MLSLSEMRAKGERKLTAKASTMKAGYDAAKSRMKASYGAAPFGATRKSAYNAGVDAGVYRAPDPTKWGANWSAKMSE